MRECLKCHQRLDVDEFYLNRRTNYRSARCKACTCAAVRANRARRLDYYQQYDRMRFDVGGARSACSAEAKARAGAAWLARNKVKRRCHGITAKAIASGLLKRGPCAVCGTADDIDAHHEDYDKPLAVVWLCKTHHGETRRKQRNPNFRPVRATRRAA